ncbi:MAG: BrnA antitoxin family protein [Castellaniella sp.]|uniref:BrnA antitoxin family protein n=1 Tax=Castellaniella sp. TaxID=1955812 RepID=UPI003C768026
MSKKDMRAISPDHDDAPELTDDWFLHAELHDGGQIVRRGRPKSAAPSVSISLRIPPDVLDRWKSSGPGWQTRMVASLKSHAPKGKHA